MVIAIVLGVLVVFAAGAGVVVWLLKREPKEQGLTFQTAVSTAKRVLQAEKPTLSMLTHGEWVPYSPRSDERDRMRRYGKYQLATEELIVTHTVEEYTDEVVLALSEHDEKVTLSYAEGELNGIWIGRRQLGAESFELRQGRGAAGNVRRLVRHHLRLPGGELDSTPSSRHEDENAAPRKKKKRRPAD